MNIENKQIRKNYKEGYIKLRKAHKWKDYEYATNKYDIPHDARN